MDNGKGIYSQTKKMEKATTTTTTQKEIKRKQKTKNYSAKTKEKEKQTTKPYKQLVTLPSCRRVLFKLWVFLLSFVL